MTSTGALERESIKQGLTAAERIHSLDVLRGCALFGMLVVHFHIHSAELGGFDDVVRTFIWRVIEGKSHGTFAFLFGAGFAIQLRRAEARDAPFTGIYLRRLAVLALFGFIAHAGFGFNVLLGYAIWGAPLLLIRRWSVKALVSAALIAAVSLSAYRAVSTAYAVATLGTNGAVAAARIEADTARSVHDGLRAAAAGASYTTLFRARLDHMAWFYTQPFFFLPGVNVAFFIMGLLAVRHRVFEDPTAHARSIVAMMAFGFVSWIAGNWLLPSTPLEGLSGLFKDQWLTFTYVGGALLLMNSRPGWGTLLGPLAFAGRMALTNYMTQIVLLDVLFSGYALGMGDIRPRYVPLAAIVVFTAQAAFSMAWLNRYRLGPAEWLWRSLTYGRPQPMRIA